MNPRLLDSCIVIDFLRRRRDAADYINRLPTTPRLSSVTVMELYAGIRGQRERTLVEAVVTESIVVDVNREIGAQAGEYLRQYRASHGIGAADAMIAATAAVQDLELATINLKHFPMFSDLKRPY